MLVTIGDLVEDVIVLLRGPVNLASDTDVQVTRRRGGSAANMAATAARLQHRVRFIGQVGDDRAGHELVDLLRRDGVDVIVRHEGRSGTIVCLVDGEGERTMLADRGTCIDLSPHDESWLDGAHTLHVPLYSLAAGRLATTSLGLIGAAHRRNVRVSIDASSVGVMAALGAKAVSDLLLSARPDVLLCNEDEARHLGQTARPDAIGGGMVVIKRGPGPATILSPGRPDVSVEAEAAGNVVDTTGAGDAFAAGFLVALASGAAPQDAVVAGHRSAAQLLLSSR